MSTRFHGVTSIGLVGIAIVIAAVVMFQASWMLGALYLVGCLIAPLGIVYAFCAKCPCRGHCAHVVFGKLAIALTNRQPGPYSRGEVAVVAVALVWLLGLPQAWLWRYPTWLIVFWVLNAIAVLQIRLAVCRSCENVHCPMKVDGRSVKTD
jgi:hypothetical protein